MGWTVIFGLLDMGLMFYGLVNARQNLGFLRFREKHIAFKNINNVNILHKTLVHHKTRAIHFEQNYIITFFNHLVPD